MSLVFYPLLILLCVFRYVRSTAQVSHGQGQARPASHATDQPGLEIPVSSVLEVSPTSPGDYPVAAGLSAEAAGASGRRGSTAVSDGACYGVAGPCQTDADHT
jgi:hypothetical protein